MSRTISRREMLKTSSALLAAGVWSTSSYGFSAEDKSPNEKLNVALIGLGGQGVHNIKGVSSQNIVALCDVDDVRAGKAYENHPGAQKFYDFREMFDKLDKQIDAVVISTPDHTHFHPAYWALERKKHLYLEKPMCHSVWESRKIADMAREKGVATQLGVQRHALNTLRAGVEIVKSGAIGEVKDVYSWINSDRGMPATPAKAEVPEHLKWDLWLGPAADRPYVADLVPYKWRFWWDFGTGESGNWGCHIMDIPFWALDLKHPSRIELLPGGDWDAERTPTKLSCKMSFPAANGRGPVTLHWMQGLPDVLAEYKVSPKDYNNLFVGSKGALLCGFGKWKLLPEEDFVGFKAPKTIPDSPGFHREWINACRGGEPATCNFEYSGPLAEAALLGNVAFQAQASFDWDAVNLKPSNPAAEPFLKSHFRKGWEV